MVFEKCYQDTMMCHHTSGLKTSVCLRSGKDTRIFQQARFALGIEEFNPNPLYDAIAIIEAFSDAFGMRIYSVG